MTTGDPLLIFLAGGATGIFGAVVAEIAASRRQARQLRHELRLEARRIALKEVDEAVNSMVGVVDALFRLRVELQDGPTEKTGAELIGCAARLTELRAHTLKLALRFGTSPLIESFSSVNDKLEEMLRDLWGAATAKKAPEGLIPIAPLVVAMAEFSAYAHEATGGLR